MENQRTTHSLIVTEWLTLAGIVIACFFFLHSEVKAVNCSMQDRMLSQEQRTDRLYEMFIDLVKDNKK